VGYRPHIALPKVTHTIVCSHKLVNRVFALQHRRSQDRKLRDRGSYARSYSPAVSNVSSVAPSTYDYSAEQRAGASSVEGDSSFAFPSRAQSHDGYPSTSTPTGAGLLPPLPKFSKPMLPRLRQLSSEASSKSRVRGHASPEATSTLRAASTSAVEVVSAMSGRLPGSAFSSFSYLKSGISKPISTSSRIQLPTSTSNSRISHLPLPSHVLSPPPSSAQVLSQSLDKHPPRLRRVGSGGNVSALINRIEDEEDSREVELRRLRELFPGNPTRKRTASREISASEFKKPAVG
jgi:hypothetical protein